jgi:hypothetical protein
MTIPPLTFTNLAVTQAAQQAKGDVTLARKYIILLGELTDDYNQVSDTDIHEHKAHLQ